MLSLKLLSYRDDSELERFRPPFRKNNGTPLRGRNPTSKVFLFLTFGDIGKYNLGTSNLLLLLELSQQC